MDGDIQIYEQDDGRLLDHGVFGIIRQLSSKNKHLHFNELGVHIIYLIHPGWKELG